MKEKVVLAYSGGLDTTAIIPWLKETYGYEVVCCCINCGQGGFLNAVKIRGIKGALHRGVDTVGSAAGISIAERGARWLSTAGLGINVADNRRG